MVKRFPREISPCVFTFGKWLVQEEEAVWMHVAWKKLGLRQLPRGCVVLCALASP